MSEKIVIKMIHLNELCFGTTLTVLNLTLAIYGFRIQRKLRPHHGRMRSVSSEEDRAAQRSAVVTLTAAVVICCVSYATYVAQCWLHYHGITLIDGVTYKKFTKVSLLSVVALVVPVIKFSLYCTQL